MTEPAFFWRDRGVWLCGLICLLGAPASLVWAIVGEQQAAAALMTGLLVAAGVGLMRIHVSADADGIEVCQGGRTRNFAWSEVVAIRSATHRELPLRFRFDQYGKTDDISTLVIELASGDFIGLPFGQGFRTKRPSNAEMVRVADLERLRVANQR